jgi:DNA-binding FadR family transcriptional regulator
MLPSEKDLKVIFQVSRGTLREALRVLEQKDLIGIRLGVRGGAFVKDAPYDSVGKSLDLLIRHKKISLHHLAEFREGIEGDVAALAAKRADQKGIADLKALLTQAQEFLEAGETFRNDFIGIDKQIHLYLAQISENPVYILLHRTIHDNIDRYYESFLSMGTREIQENYDDLCQIVAAIEQGDTEKARTLARSHVLQFNHYMAAQKKQRR